MCYVVTRFHWSCISKQQGALRYLDIHIEKVLAVMAGLGNCVFGDEQMAMPSVSSFLPSF